MPSVSKQQQKLFGLVRALQKGDVPPGKVSKQVKDLAKKMKKSDVKAYASTKHDDLPKKVKREDLRKLVKKYGAKRVKESVFARVEKGWSMDDVFSSEVSNRTRIKNRKPKKIYKFDGKIYKSSYELADRLNMNPSTVRLWICKNKDKTLNEIFLNKKLRG
jgi:hypothetical protein